MSTEPPSKVRVHTIERKSYWKMGGLNTVFTHCKISFGASLNCFGKVDSTYMAQNSVIGR